MKGKLLWSIFWALVGVFVVVVGTIFIGPPIFGRLEMPALFSALFGGTVALFGLGMVGLGVTLLVLTIEGKSEGDAQEVLSLDRGFRRGTACFRCAAQSRLCPVYLLLWRRLLGSWR